MAYALKGPQKYVRTLFRYNFGVIKHDVVILMFAFLNMAAAANERLVLFVDNSDHPSYLLQHWNIDVSSVSCLVV